MNLQSPNLRRVLLAALVTSLLATARGQSNSVPDLRRSLSQPQNEMRVVAQRYTADRGNLTRFYTVAIDPERIARLNLFDADWLVALQKINTNSLTPAGRGEYSRLVENINKDVSDLDTLAKSQAELEPLLPFGQGIIDLETSRRRVEKMDAIKAAGAVDGIARRVSETRKALMAATNASGTVKFDLTQAGHAAESLTTLREVLRNWNKFYYGYDPLFTWWVAEPFKEADQAIGEYLACLRQVADAHPRDEASRVMAGAVALPAIKLVGKAPDVPDLLALMAYPQSQMRGVIEQFSGNRGGRGGGGRGGFGRGGARRGRPELQNWLEGLRQIDFDSLNRGDQVNYILLRNRIEYQLRMLDLNSNEPSDTGPFLTFESELRELGESRENYTGARASEPLAHLAASIASARSMATNALSVPDASTSDSARRAARAIYGLRNTLSEWHDRNTQDTPWPDGVAAAYKELDQALDDYATLLRDRSGAGAQRDGSDIVGRPIGREAMMASLYDEMIPYTPEELIEIGNREFAWTEAQLKKNAREMGLGDDWKKAVEKCKTLHVDAGQQPYLIEGLSWDAVNYLEQHDLITIPMIARETWGMEMMSPERQLVNPFFTGGPLISVSYPTDTMTQEQKLESMRGNNIPFAHATVFHELIPGHELQGFTAARFHTERRMFNTAFYVEGWAVYWELLMYRRGFDTTPEQRVGALFWRLHRCARIVFSLNFHLKKWTPAQCIDYLVDKVGHERENATAEVRRSFAGGYAPLHEAGYLLGALALMDLHHEMVDSGKMKDREFNDAVIEQGAIPISMVRAALDDEKLTPDYHPNWRFYGQNVGTAITQK